MAAEERHLLVSSRLGPVTGHGYLARRGDQHEAKNDFNYVSNALSSVMESTAGATQTFWLPVLLSTELDAATGRDVQALFRQAAASGHRQQDRRRLAPLDAFQAGREAMFMAVWMMPTADPDCERLMELH